jgi:hypothetical protein
VRNLDRGLPFTRYGSAYRLGIGSIDENELLITTDAPGPAAMLANVGKACELDGNLAVSGDELRSLTVTRRLRQLGPILFALLSTDGAFAAALPSAYTQFWTASMGLVGAVSKEGWERKLLIRAQSPGVSPETVILQDVEGAAPLGEPEAKRNSILDILTSGSQTRAAPFLPDAKPIERFDLDVTLRALRKELGIVPSQSAGREAYLLISGSVRTTGSDFCRRATRRGGERSRRPGWSEQAGKAFVLEVWSAEAARAMTSEGRAETVTDAPAGVMRCKIEGGAGGDGIALYAVASASLTADASREAAFAYLQARAVEYLRPTPTD